MTHLICERAKCCTSCGGCGTAQTCTHSPATPPPGGCPHEALDAITAHVPDLHLVGAVTELLDDGAWQVIAVPADVAREKDVARIAETTVAEFGRFDTWVNNAAVSVSARRPG